MIAVVVCAGCAASRTAMWVAAADPPPADVSGVIALGERAFEEREDSARLDEALRQWRTALRETPGDAALLVKLSRAARLRAHDVRGRAGDALADEAVGFAERALALREPLRKRARELRPATAVFEAAERDDEPALIAYAEALFDWSERRGLATLMAQQDWIRAAAHRAVVLDRAAGHGAPDRVLAMLEATLPLDSGALLLDSLERFEASVASAPRYLPTRLEYAQRYAVRVRDGRLYRRLLEEVVAADADALADARPENRAAQRAARRLLAD